MSNCDGAKWQRKPLPINPAFAAARRTVLHCSGVHPSTVEIHSSALSDMQPEEFAECCGVA